MTSNPWLIPFSESNGKKLKWIEALEVIGVKTPFDLLWILPNKFLPITDEDKIFSLADLTPGQYIRVRGRVSQSYFKPLFFRKGKGRPLLHHAFGKITSSKYQWKLQGFNLYPPAKDRWQQWDKLEAVTLVGVFDVVQGKITISNPKLENNELDKSLKELVISYPAIKGINTSQWNKLVENYIKKNWEAFPQTPEVFQLVQSFKTIHGVEPHLIDDHLAIENIKTYELWCEQNLILQKKEQRKKTSIKPLLTSQIEFLLDKTPWPLTQEQQNALRDILDDLQKSYPMRRLLQGEVGSGKTIIAFLSAYALAKANKIQVALIAPTETLARQHFDKWVSFFGESDKDVSCLAYYASFSTKEKKVILNKIKDGLCQVIIGTHALFQKDVEYKNLSYIIIDEQHRFGVEQRKTLFSKGNHPHTLMMSATPIPRTLGLTHFGDLEQSVMLKSPFGEKNIKTRLVEKTNFEQYLSFVKTRLQLGEQIYVVAPVIEESEHFTFHLKYLETFFTEHFSQYQVAILHGKLKEEEQRENFKQYLSGQAAILVATTMIEVGIDVANATVICIYHPEQFGLSSLHQLRGRVGRSKKSGFCFLVAPYALDQDARERLQFFEANLDGFVLAEKDFNLRGQGNLWGIEQSGKISPYRVARIPEDRDLLLTANELAQKQELKLKLVLPSHFLGHFDGDNEQHYWL